jgi:dolichyl-phosphate beta-glucosyltransferase
MIPASSIELSIVIPCYKEGQKILKDLEAATEFLNQNQISGEIIVVDDGSPDRTAQIADEFATREPRVQVVRYEINRGKGYAIRQGVAASSGQYVMFADAGLCVPFHYALVGLRLLKEGPCDMAIASRALPESQIKKASPTYRQIGSKVFWILLRLFMGIPPRIRDTQCGFKLYDGKKARALFAQCFVDGFMIDIELLRRAFQSNWKVEHFPVEWHNDIDTRFNPVFGSWRLIWDLVVIRLKT